MAARVPRVARTVSLVLVLVGCNSSSVKPSSPTPDTPTAELGSSSEAAPAPSNPEASTEPESEPESELEAPVYDELIAKLTAGTTPSAESEPNAWSHYKAKRYAEAQRDFALASLHDRAAWKHPFNLACASARLRDEAMVRVGLTEAVARDAEATAAKARSDGDLAPYRAAPWFETILGRRPHEDPDEDEPERQTDAELAGPKLREPHPLPAGRHVPLAADKLEQVRAELMNEHGLYSQIRGSLEFTDDAGALRGYVVYDYPVIDECMLKRHKKVCLERFGEGPEFDRYDRTHCTKQWIARVSFTGEAEVEVDTRALDFACGPANVYRLDLLDADNDGAEEVVIDVRSRAELLGMRYTSDYASGRIFEIHRLDGSSQFRFNHRVHTYEILDISDVFRRVVTRDLDEDGHIDFVIQSREVETNSRYRFTDEFWPDMSDDRHVEIQGLTTEIRRYKPDEDRW